MAKTVREVVQEYIGKLPESVRLLVSPYADEIIDSGKNEAVTYIRYVIDLKWRQVFAEEIRNKPTQDIIDELGTINDNIRNLNKESIEKIQKQLSIIGSLTELAISIMANAVG